MYTGVTKHEGSLLGSLHNKNSGPWGSVLELTGGGPYKAFDQDSRAAPRWVQGSGFKVQGLGVKGLRLRARALRYKVQESMFKG